MTKLDRVLAIARQLQQARLKQAETVKALEEKLTVAVWEQLEGVPGSLRSKARRMGISVPYLCDIVHGRRGVSDAVLEKLKGLG